MEAQRAKERNELEDRVKIDRQRLEKKVCIDHFIIQLLIIILVYNNILDGR